MRLLRQRWLMAILSISGGGGSVWAADYPSEQDYLQEFPVVLSASRLAQPVSEAPNAMTVIDSEMIAASGFRNIADLFRLVPGMYVGYSDGHTPFVGYHGNTDQFARRMQVLVDGRSVYLPPMGGVDWKDIPLNISDIERIEVIRGPAAASHGANSLKGVISIITRDAGSANGTAVSLTRGNGGISDASVRLGKSLEDLDFRITAGYRADDGYDLKAINDSSSTRMAGFRGNYRVNLEDSVDFQAGHSEGVRSLGIMNRMSEPFRDYRASSDFQQVDWLHVLPRGDEIKVSYYHISRSSQDSSINAIDKDNSQVHRHDLSVQHTMQLGDSNRLVWGGGVRRDSAKTTVTFNAPQYVRLYQAFAHDEMRFGPSWLVNVGAMLENDGYRHTNLSPRVSLNYHLTPQHTFRAGASVAYRSPAMFEERANTNYLVGRPYRSLGGLRPERTLAKEVSYLGEFGATGLSLDARIFSERVSDIIFADPQPTAPLSFSFSNLYEARYEGFESTLKYRWGERSNLTFNYAHQRASCTSTNSMTIPQLSNVLQSYMNLCPLTVPADSGSILLTEQLSPRLQMNAGYYHQEKVQVLDAQSPQTLMRRLDLRMAYAFGRQGEPGGGEIALVMQNALQDNYTEYTNVPQKAGFIFNRRTYLTATLEF